MKAKRDLPPFAARVKLAARHILGHARATPMIEVSDDDVALASYPKSGNTWMRFMLANLMYPSKQVTFENIDSLVPTVYGRYYPFLRKVPRLRIIKTHECFDPRFERVLLLVRDPRDVAISYYHHLVNCRSLAKDYSFDRFVDEFIAGSLPDPFGTWQQNVGSWLGARVEDDTFLILRYEDLLEEAASGLRRAADLIGFEVTDDQLERAVAASSKTSMQKLEQESGDRWRKEHRLSGGRFVRVGMSGKWRSELSA